MSNTDDLLARNALFAAGFDATGLPMAPGRKVAISKAVGSARLMHGSCGQRWRHGDRLRPAVPGSHRPHARLRARLHTRPDEGREII